MNPYYFNISKLHRTPVNSMTSSHAHTFWELFYLTQGKCGVLIRDTLYEINAGTIFLIPSDISHRTLYNLPDSERFVVEFGSDFVSEITSNLTDTNFYHKYCCRFFTFNSAELNLVNHYFDTLLTESITPNALSPVTIKHSIQGILLAMVHSGSDITASLNIKNSFNTDNIIIQNAINYIEENFNDSVSLTALSKHLHINASYLSKLFKDETGSTFKDFLNQTRISHAERLLLETNFSVSDVAAQCGYESGNYFGDVFKKAKGVPPIKFRELKGYII